MSKIKYSVTVLTECFLFLQSSKKTNIALKNCKLRLKLSRKFECLIKIMLFYSTAVEIQYYLLL